tara:strand:+ start:519 stop:992 length:474 start_codon:yes stop_codon:yes gene_type:complete
MTINVPQSVHDELAEIRERMGKFQEKLRNVRADLESLKPIQRITKKVREAAMKHFATTTFVQGAIPLSEPWFSQGYTFENFVRLTDWSGLLEEDRKWFTSKQFEKRIYENYKMFENKRVDERRRELNESRRKLEREIEILGETEDNLRLTFGMELCT